MSRSFRAALAACSAVLPACNPTAAASTHRPALEHAAAGATAAAAPTQAPGAEARPACPEGMAKVDGVCIDRWEAHLVTRDPDGGHSRHAHYLRPAEGRVYEARSAPGVFPQAYISRVESEAACAEAGKRLCTRREWQRACGYRADGRPGGTYPYGDRWQPNACNSNKAHVLTLRFGADSRLWRYADFNDPTLDQMPDFLARSGAYAGCVGDAGVYDMVGNLHEWVSDTADAAFEARIRNEGVARAFQYWSPGNGVFMGGFYSTLGELGPGCTFTTVAHERRYHDYSTGFRCCADAE